MTEPVAFGPFLITRRLARGGMAEIYRAWTPELECVALKLMRPGLGEEELRTRLFAREARIALELEHPNIVSVRRVGEEEGRAFLAMEYLRGRDLARILTGPDGRPVALPPDLALFVGQEAARGLGYAHRRADAHGRALGIVHRDVSPGNVMVSFDGGVQILDFGVARIEEESSESTSTGILRGKFAYMSPEQTRGDDLDARSDVFSLGTLIYELMTGANCFRADEPIETLERVQSLRPAPPSRARDLPRSVDEVLARCLAKEPARRYRDGIELAEALQPLLEQLGTGGAPALAALLEARFGAARGLEEAELEEERAALVQRGAGAPGIPLGRGLVPDQPGLRPSKRDEVERARVEALAASRPDASTSGSVFDAEEKTVRLATRRRSVLLALQDEFRSGRRPFLLGGVVGGLAALIGGLGIISTFRDRSGDGSSEASAPAVDPNRTSSSRKRRRRRRTAAAAKRSHVRGKKGFLSVFSKPQGTVIINGRRTRGRTPRRDIALRPGRHRIVVVGPGGRRAERVVRIRPGRSVTVRLELRKP
ncbi:MAG: serine/threonine-protein kinase [Myxococcota bacterium]